MSETGGYLRSNVAIELLQSEWYAWPYLLSPVTGAMLVANAHLKTMQSFVANPELHVVALRDPAMRGGPFMDCDASRIDEVRGLMEQTTKHQGHLIELAEAVKALDRILAEEATGYSLLPLYPKVPERLRGYVELVYDREHHAYARFLEGLLYQSTYYDERGQSIVLSTIGDTQRPFVFSTPRLARPGDLRLRVPFASRGLDELYRARNTPQPLARLAEILDVQGEDVARFAAFFSEEPPRESAPRRAGDVRIRYFGHACVLIEADGVSILVDPIISHDYDCGVSRYSHADLPPTIDYVLITHNHQDHCLLEPLLELRHRARSLVIPRSLEGTLLDPSLRRLLGKIGFERVIELGEMEQLPIEGGAILGVPFLGEHADLDVRTKLAYHVRVGGRTVMLMADSNNLETQLYDRVHGLIGDVDVIFIGMECEGAPMSFLYGPMFTRPLARKMDHSRRLDGSNFERARDIVRRFAAKQVYVYAMGQEPWLAYLMSLPYTETSIQIVESNKLVQECRDRGIVAERLYCQKEIVL